MSFESLSDLIGGTENGKIIVYTYSVLPAAAFEGTTTYAQAEIRRMREKEKAANVVIKHLLNI